MVRRLPLDHAARAAAVRERERTVLIDAGAGTGKTTILVDRLVAMVAPDADRLPAVPVERLAAITFTRKAAGELRLRIRERFLQGLGEPGLTPTRRDRLRRALTGLDTAAVGTIDAFADRLLRQRPVEAGLSPSYEIVDDAGPLARETFEVLMHAVENGTLSGELVGAAATDRADEATLTVLSALGVGLLAESHEGTHNDQHGLDALVAGFIGQRDVPPPEVAPVAFDAAAFRVAADAVIAPARALAGRSDGARYLRATAELLASVRDREEPALLLSRLRRQMERAPRGSVTLRDTFEGDKAAWEVWKRYTGELRAALTAPLYRWLATRLARLSPIVVALYERVKARHQVLDHLDLLVKLRDLLRDDLAVRGDFQRLFDHVFVDEFQDTDPLQAEIVLFLCEREPVAARWDEVTLRPGSLTLVGDPKQSIYRFRRADVAMYDRVRHVIGPHLIVKLSTNFRSVPPLIDWLNDRFDRVLGISPDGRPFDAATGRVFQQRLVPGRRDGDGPAVHVLPFEFDAVRDPKADDYRRLEGEAVGRYLRWLVEGSGIEVRDPVDGSRRAIRYGDVAVLAVTTWRLPLLFPCLDREGIPYASRGGTLFLSDPGHRQFLLGLRALADAEDGVAEAALLRPPFFAVDLGDIARERVAMLAGREADDEAGRRAAEARRLVRELRQQRFLVSPGTTARDLLERTALARAVALGPNGAQRLARLREICLELEHQAGAEGLDYDAVTARLRGWVGHPVALDPPHPVGGEAVQVLTIHQAKGLEFPVVVLWDGRGLWDARLDTGPWHMERDGSGWIMGLHDLQWEEPPGRDLARTEKTYLDAERRRVIYVAATRARDLLVVPRAGEVPAGKRFVCGDLLGEAPPGLVRVLATYRDGHGSDWANALHAPAAPPEADSDALETEIDARWRSAAEESARPRWSPVGVTDVAHAASGRSPIPGVQHLAALPTPAQSPPAEPDVDPVAEPRPEKAREGRFGSTFGSAVHHALGMLLEGRAPDPREAVTHAAARLGMVERLEDAVADVERALAALRAEGLTGPPGPHLRVEYPVAGAWEGGMLVSGYVDVLGATAGGLDVIDLKTDHPPAGAVGHAYPAYAGQVRAYARLLEAAGLTVGRQLRCGLLFTADGVIRWV